MVGVNGGWPLCPTCVYVDSINRIAKCASVYFFLGNNAVLVHYLPWVYSEALVQVENSVIVFKTFRS